MNKQAEREIPAASTAVVEVQNLSIGFYGQPAPVVDGISFHIKKGEIYGLVGESGCGKTITGLSLLRLLPSPAGYIAGGKIRFLDQEVTDLSDENMRKIRGAGISMIFQEPSAAMNPVYTIGRQLREPFAYHSYSGNQDQRIFELLKRVGFADPERVLDSYPHQLSGGMLQRIVIAMALLLKPALIIADEPTTALDVTIQAQIMELLVEMQKETGASVLLITHNLGLIAQYADRVAVMYAGKIVEESPVDSFIEKPFHPYSNGLMKAIPDITLFPPKLSPIPGNVPAPHEYGSGCRFRSRCSRAFEPCDKEPPFIEIEKDRKTACFLYTDS